LETGEEPNARKILNAHAVNMLTAVHTEPFAFVFSFN
jgi:hypothetical protein